MRHCLEGGRSGGFSKVQNNINELSLQANLIPEYQQYNTSASLVGEPVSAPADIHTEHAYPARMKLRRAAMSDTAEFKILTDQIISMQGNTSQPCTTHPSSIQQNAQHAT